MPPPDPRVYRPLEVWEAMRLTRASPLAVRVYLLLFWGEDSERAGVVRCRSSVLAHDLESSRRAVEAALAELVSIGLIEFDSGAGVAGRVGFVARHLPPATPNVIAWRRSVTSVPDCFISQQAREIIDSRIELRSEPRSQRRSERSVEPRSQRRSEPQDHKSTSPQDQSLFERERPGASRTGVAPPAPPFRPPTYEDVEARLRHLGWEDDHEVHIEASAYVAHRARTGWLAPTGVQISDWVADLTYWLAQGQKAVARREAAKASGSAFEVRWGKKS